MSQTPEEAQPRINSKENVCIHLDFSLFLSLPPSLRSLESGRVLSKLYNTFIQLFAACHLIPPTPQSLNSMHSGEQLGTIALREASTMIQQTGMGQSTPNLATKKILQGHHSDSPTEGTGQGAEG